HRALSEHKTLSISWSHYQEQDEDDPYADFKVPDDLMW
ncbi:DUF2058 family protein, partial [Escherichia coli]|nr:DUF2058 family protein [Escherichia coli]